MVQVGVDFGGTKIEAAVLAPDGEFLARGRTPTPDSYDQSIRDVCALIERAEGQAGARGTIGVGLPGSVNPRDGRMRNANATFLNGRTFREDLQAALGRPVRVANDANCLALSEVVDGAAQAARCAFAVIIGTGLGGGLVVDGAIVEGGGGLAGEWGHVPLPWMGEDEYPGPACWCGRTGCLEALISGTGFQADYRRRSGVAMAGADIVVAARSGERIATATLDVFIDRLARAFAMVANIADPDIFVLGGGMSNVTEIYDRVPALIPAYVFGGDWDGQIVPARWGDSSGVRGAARLWTAEEARAAAAAD